MEKNYIKEEKNREYVSKVAKKKVGSEVIDLYLKMERFNLSLWQR